MQPYDDILVRAVASAPWEARSINGPHHDTADWLGSGAGFPLPVERLTSEPEEAGLASRSAAAAKGSWGYFELSGGQAGWAGTIEANRWTLDAPADAVRSPRASALFTVERLAEAARDHRTASASAANTKRTVRQASAPSEGAAACAGLAALAALRDAARTRREGQTADAPAAKTHESPASEGLSALRALRDAARASRPASDEPPSTPAAPCAVRHAGESLASAYENPRERTLATPAAKAVGADRRPSRASSSLLEEKRITARKAPYETRRVSVVSANDPFAAHLLRACLLASASAKRPLSGLEEIAPANDLEECTDVVYLSHTLCSADGWSVDPGAKTEAEIEAVASASLTAFDGALVPAHPDAAPGARADRAFVLLDFTGSPWIGEELPAAFAQALRVGRCVVVLAESARTDVWEQLLARVRSACAPGVGAPGEPLEGALSAFSVGEGALRSAAGRSRFLRAWWAWFGSGSRWGFHELGGALERALGVLGLNLHHQPYDLGLVSLIASLLRDGGTIASADDVAEALADRFPNRDLLQRSVNAAMDALLREKPRVTGDRVFLSADELFAAMDARADRPASLEAIMALRFSPSLQTLLRMDGAWIEVRFSSLFACLAARWFLGDGSRTALQVADSLEALAGRVPAGGWGRIVLQTALLAGQRGQSYAGRVILDRLYARTDEADRQTMLAEISLGLFLDTGGALPSIWRDVFFNGSINRTQARVLAEARKGSWLRAENLHALRHAAHALAARVRTGEVRADDPPNAASVCAWMDTLLRAAQATNACELFDQVTVDLASSDPLLRRAALGRYDCLVWACLFGVELPCPTWRADALREGPLYAAARAAADELASGGPAYVECARFAWLYATECPRLWRIETWQRAGEAAARILRDAAHTADEERRYAAHEVLAAYALRMGERGIDPLPAAGAPETRALPTSASVEQPAPPEAERAHEAEAPNAAERLYALMARAATGAISLEEARTRACESIDPADLGSVATYQLKMLLAPSNIAKGEPRCQPAAQPSARAPQHSLAPEALHELAARWRACIGRLLPENV